MGKHTDYCGGRSLLAATSYGFCIIVTKGTGAQCKVHTTQSGIQDPSIILDFSSEPRKGHWSNYVSVTLNRLGKNFGKLRGVNISLASDIPPASGMSTSSALICAVFLAVDWENNIRGHELFLEELPDAERFYEYLGCIENGQSCNGLEGHQGVGTFGGSEDHTAVMSCEPGHLKCFYYCPTKFDGKVKLPEQLCFVIASSGVIADKTGSKMDDYNRAALLARKAADLWYRAALLSKSQEDPLQGRACHLQNILSKEDVTINQMTQFFRDSKENGVIGDKPVSGVDLAERVVQFYEESFILIPKVMQSLQNGDFEQLKQAVQRSQELSDTHLKNIVTETRWLPAEALKLGAVASSAFGAGFGGSVWALIEKEKAQEFLQNWQKAYENQFPQWKENAQFRSMIPGPSAFLL